MRMIIWPLIVLGITAAFTLAYVPVELVEREGQAQTVAPTPGEQAPPAMRAAPAADLDPATSRALAIAAGVELDAACGNCEAGAACGGCASGAGCGSCETVAAAVTAAGCPSGKDCANCAGGADCADCASCENCQQAETVSVPAAAGLTGDELYLVVASERYEASPAEAVEALQALDGVLRVDDVGSRQLIVRRDADRASAGQVLKALYDAGFDPQVQSVATRHLDVEGVCCPNCWNKMHDAVRALPGVRASAHDAEAAVLSVAYDPAAGNLAAVRKAITGLNDEAHHYETYVATEGIDLAVEGLACPACEQVLTTALKRLPDVQDVFVSHLSGQVFVQEARGAGLLANVLQTVRGLGFTVTDIVNGGTVDIAARPAATPVATTTTAAAAACGGGSCGGDGCEEAGDCGGCGSCGE